MDGNDLRGHLSKMMPSEGWKASSTYLGTKHVHSEDVQSLATNVLGAHVHDTLEAKAGTDRSSRNTVLSSTRLGDDTRLSNTASKQKLSDGIVDLM